MMHDFEIRAFVEPLRKVEKPLLVPQVMVVTEDGDSRRWTVHGDPKARVDT